MLFPLYSNLVLLQSHIDFVVLPARTCLQLHFLLQVNVFKVWEFPRPGHEDMRVQAAIRPLALCQDGPITGLQIHLFRCLS